jgi:hypothetical protein
MAASPSIRRVGPIMSPLLDPLMHAPGLPIRALQTPKTFLPNASEEGLRTRAKQPPGSDFGGMNPAPNDFAEKETPKTPKSR